MAEDSIVVLGGTGFLGQAFAMRWQRGERVLRYLVHRKESSWLRAMGIDTIRVDLDDRQSVISGLGGSHTAINLLRPVGDGWYPRQMRTLVPYVKAAGVTRFVHASSIDVYGNSRHRLVNETTPTLARTPYEREHKETEDIVLGELPGAVVLRLGAVFGKGGRNIVSLANEISTAPNWKLAARRMLYGARRMHLVSAETVCLALMFVCSYAGSLSSQRFIVTDDRWEENNFGHVQDALAVAFGRPSLQNVPSLPFGLLKAVLAISGKSPSLVDRRFIGEELRKLDFAGADFTTELAQYAKFLASRSTDLT